MEGYILPFAPKLHKKESGDDGLSGSMYSKECRFSLKEYRFSITICTWLFILLWKWNSSKYYCFSLKMSVCPVKYVNQKGINFGLWHLVGTLSMANRRPLLMTFNRSKVKVKVSG